MRVMVTHDVEDVQHWLASPKRDAFFSAHGMTVRTFTSPDGGHNVGVVIENVPDMATLQAALETEEAAAAMEHDRVDPATMRMYVES